MMKIKQFEVIDRCLFWREKKILVVGDLHLGYEEELMERGVSFPKTQIDETVELFEKILEKTGKLSKIILLGDVKHYFAGILREEFGDFYKLVELFKKNLLRGGRVIITKGNHDNILEPIVRDYDFVELVDFYFDEESGTLFFHGDKKSFEMLGSYPDEIKTLVIGHFHSAISISEDSKKEKYKCFLFGKSKFVSSKQPYFSRKLEKKELKKEMIILPSFFPLIEGSDILVDGTNILNRSRPGFAEKNDFHDFEVYLLSGEFGEVLGFGKVKTLL